MKIRTTGIRFTLAMLNLAGLFATVWFLAMYTEWTVKEPTNVYIAKGSSTARVSGLLKNSGIIRNKLLFRVLARLSGHGHSIHYGNSRFSGRLNTSGLLAQLSSGGQLQRHVVIPEGSNLWQINEIFRRNGITSSTEFLDTAMSPESVCAWLNVPAETMEGFLFPDTYIFNRNTSAQVVVNKMFARFRQIAAKYMPQYSGRRLYDLVNLASLVEKEAVLDRERPLISAVFHNRLRIRMHLGCDPTVRYALGKFTGPLKKKDMHVDSPYNTYLHYDLPPGPVTNPGLASIKAAMHPADVPYLYFVVKNEHGAHEFSRTLVEHNRAVARYRRLRRRQKRGQKPGQGMNQHQDSKQNIVR